MWCGGMLTYAGQVACTFGKQKKMNILVERGHEMKPKVHPRRDGAWLSAALYSGSFAQEAMETHRHTD